MAYSANKTINGLDVETTIADTDELVFGDVSDSNRAKKITYANFKTDFTADDTAFVRKSDYDANTILYATSDNTPVALTVGTNSVVGRVAGNITTLAVDSDLTSVSASDDTVPSAKATKTALDLKANDADVVHDTGNETIAGVKTFSSDPIIPDEAYGSGWNGVLEPPTKNAVYDKIETLFVGTFTNGVTTRAGNTASGDQTIAHGLGKVPKKIKITVTKVNSTNGGPVVSVGTYNGTTNSCVWMVGYDTGNGNTQAQAGNSSTQIAYVPQIQPGSTGNQAAIATFDATNITLSWTLTSTVNSSDMNIMWEAEG